MKESIQHNYKINHLYIIKTANISRFNKAEIKKILILEMTEFSILVSDEDAVYDVKRYEIKNFIENWTLLEDLGEKPAKIKPVVDSKQLLIEDLLKIHKPLPPTEFIPNVGMTEKVPFYTYCGCNPSNGGSGVCGCTMGRTMTDKRY